MTLFLNPSMDQSSTVEMGKENATFFLGLPSKKVPIQ